MSAAAKLRPAKIRSAMRRRWFERQLPRLALTPMPGLVDVGSPYGGWTIPVDLVTADWTCWSIGAGGDITFDLALLNQGALVRSFEPAPQYVAGAEDHAAGRERFSAHQVAIAAEDGPLRLQVTHHEGSSSVSSANLYDTDDSFIEVPGRTLASLQAELGDARIDLLKLDIEGAEYGVMPTADLRALGVSVFATQLHHTGSVADAHTLIAAVEAQGYTAVACRPVVKLTFVRTDLLPPRA
jgi:FkbM family methyltransferase